MKLLQPIRLSAVWVAAVLLAVLPIAVAVDFGGILRWTHFIICLAVLAITVLSLAAYWDQSNKGQLRQHILLLPLGAWLLFAAFQTLSLPPGIVKLLSPASHVAYTQWLEPIIPADQLPQSFSISVAPHDSRHAVAMLALVMSTVFASALVFCTRKRIIFLLSACAIGVSLHVGYALLRLVFPGADLFDQAQDLAYGSFGTFINRNNAALFMNLGLACSLGLLSWRLTALTGQELDDEQFEFNDLVSLVGDRDSMIGVVCAVFCIGGLLLCGSRGGIVSILFGVLLAFGWVRQKRGFATLPVLATVIGISAAILLVPLQLNMKSIERFEFFNSEARTFASDGRLMHWPDGFQAAVSHLPAGSGLSTYAFANLPHQSGVMKAWAQHADNLWLELFVEQGLFGLALVVAILYLIVRSLILLRESPDPIDQGLRTAGWYIIGAVACSQFFDFGLILPANFLMLAVLFPAIIARRVSTGMSDAESESADDLKPRSRQKTGQKSIFSGQRRTPAFMAIAATVIAMPALAIPKLKRNAEVESLVRTAQFQRISLRRDARGLSELSKKLTAYLGSRPDPRLMNTLSDVVYSQARLAEVLQQRPKSTEEVDELFRKIKPIERKQQQLEVSPAVIEQYHESLTWYNQSLSVFPLGINSRSGKLYLDFLNADPKQTHALIDQLFALHRNNPSALLLLGEYAAHRDQYDLAARLWETAAREQNGLTIKTISLSQEYDQISLDDVIPQKPKAVRIAARRLLQFDDSAALEYLRTSLDAVACDQCDSLDEKSACLSLRGDIAYKLQQHELAFEQYEAAIQCDPSNAAIRLKLVRRLREQGRSKEARIEARRGRTVIPGDQRFDSMIKAIAQEDLRKARQ